MPEFFSPECNYQKKVQANLSAIAKGIKSDHQLICFLLEGTLHASAYEQAELLWAEQWKIRDPNNLMICPFWTNYWYNPCQACNCRIDSSVSMEIDAMFFLKNPAGKILAIHLEMKRDHEQFTHGQAEAYLPRAACYREQRRERKGLLAHDDFLAVLFCGAGTDLALAKRHFSRVVLHSEASRRFPGYPT
jgi:hypothetical protein